MFPAPVRDGIDGCRGANDQTYGPYRSHESTLQAHVEEGETEASEGHVSSGLTLALAGRAVLGSGPSDLRRPPPPRPSVPPTQTLRMPSSQGTGLGSLGFPPTASSLPCPGQLLP